MQISFSYFEPGHRNLWGMRRCLLTLQENPVGFLEPWLSQFTILATNYQEWPPYKLQIKLEQWWMPPFPSPICSMALNVFNIYPKDAKQRLDYKGLSHCLSTKFNSSRETSHYVRLCWFHFFPYAGFSLSYRMSVVPTRFFCQMMDHQVHHLQELLCIQTVHWKNCTHFCLTCPQVSRGTSAFISACFVAIINFLPSEKMFCCMNQVVLNQDSYTQAPDLVWCNSMLCRISLSHIRFHVWNMHFHVLEPSDWIWHKEFVVWEAGAPSLS